MSKIKVAVVGIGNCASSLIQGIHYYQGKSEDAIGLMHWEIGGYTPEDIEVVAAFDIDKRKIGMDVSEAIFSEPNCTTVFQADIPKSGVKVTIAVSAIAKPPIVPLTVITSALVLVIVAV